MSMKGCDFCDFEQSLRLYLHQANYVRMNPDRCHVWSRKCPLFPEHLISLPLGSSWLHPSIIYIVSIWKISQKQNTCTPLERSYSDLSMHMILDLFDVMRGDAVMHVDFTLHWLLPFEHAWKHFFNYCSVKQWFITYDTPWIVWGTGMFLTVNNTHKVPYASNSYVCFNHGTFSMHCRTTLCYG